jgi:hypothetical protein
MKDLPEPLPTSPVIGNDVMLPARMSEQLPHEEPAAPCDELASDDTMYVDWDVMIENPPVRHGRTVTVHIVPGGRRLPNLPDDPRD